jgi:hypothetical protein
MAERYTRRCAVCGRALTPHTPQTLTAHEFRCYEAHPDKVPEEHRERMRQELLGEKRSKAAKRGVATKRAKYAQWPANRKGTNKSQLRKLILDFFRKTCYDRDHNGRGAMRWTCRCGEIFSNRRLLTEHIGLQNPHWPRTSPEDKHADETTEQVSSAIVSYRD